MRSERISAYVDEIDDFLGWIVHEAYDPYDVDVTKKEAKQILANLRVAQKYAEKLLKEVNK